MPSTPASISADDELVAERLTQDMTAGIERARRAPVVSHVLVVAKCKGKPIRRFHQGTRNGVGFPGTGNMAFDRPTIAGRVQATPGRRSAATFTIADDRRLRGHAAVSLGTAGPAVALGEMLERRIVAEGSVLTPPSGIARPRMPD